MPILNYTTTIDAGKTAGEIQGLLAWKGARTVSIEYQTGQPSGIYFSIDVHGNPINFRLPCNWEGVLRAMKKDPKVPGRLRTEDQARRVAWRIIKDWVESQLAIIEAGQAELAEVFLPYAVLASGQTVYNKIAHEPRLLLGM